MPDVPTIHGLCDAHFRGVRDGLAVGTEIAATVFVTVGG